MFGPRIIRDKTINDKLIRYDDNLNFIFCNYWLKSLDTANLNDLMKILSKYPNCFKPTKKIIVYNTLGTSVT